MTFRTTFFSLLILIKARIKIFQNLIVQYPITEKLKSKFWLVLLAEVAQTGRASG